MLHMRKKVRNQSSIYSIELHTLHTLLLGSFVFRLLSFVLIADKLLHCLSPPAPFTSTAF